jgi:membrane protein involved in colicin uptake
MKLILTTLAALVIGVGSLKADDEFNRHELYQAQSDIADLERTVSYLESEVSQLKDQQCENVVHAGPPLTDEERARLHVDEKRRAEEQAAKTAAMYKELAEKRAKDAEEAKQFKADWDERMKAQKEFLSDTTKSGAYEKYRNTIEKLNR